MEYIGMVWSGVERKRGIRKRFEEGRGCSRSREIAKIGFWWKWPRVVQNVQKVRRCPLFRSRALEATRSK